MRVFNILISTLFCFSFQNAVGQSPEKKLGPSSLPEVTIFTNIGLTEGTLKSKEKRRYENVKKFMNDTKIPFKINLVPWTRAFRSAQTQKNTLIFELDKTPDREDQFHWIYPLRTDSYQLISLNAMNKRNLTKKKILEGNFTGMCGKNTSACKIFKDFGFPEDRIIQVPITNSKSMANLLMHKRADFIIGKFDFFVKDLKLDSIPPRTFYPVLDIIQTTTFLAAGKNIDPLILTTLLKTAKNHKNSPEN